jgi:hypothetical protein
MKTTQKARFRMRLTGDKHDYIRRYTVWDLVTKKRIDGVPGGLTEADARDMVRYETLKYGCECPGTGDSWGEHAETCPAYHD